MIESMRRFDPPPFRGQGKPSSDRLVFDEISLDQQDVGALWMSAMLP
jgi:hypothetical protein